MYCTCARDLFRFHFVIEKAVTEISNWHCFIVKSAKQLNNNVCKLGNSTKARCKHEREQLAARAIRLADTSELPMKLPLGGRPPNNRTENTCPGNPPESYEYVEVFFGLLVWSPLAGLLFCLLLSDFIALLLSGQIKRFHSYNFKEFLRKKFLLYTSLSILCLLSNL